MTKNELNIQTLSNKRTDKLANHFLLLGQMIELKEITNTSYYIIFLFASLTNDTFSFTRYTSKLFAKPKEHIFPKY
jgi:hypothetical protein